MTDTFKIENLARINQYINFNDEPQPKPLKRSKSVVTMSIPEYQSKTDKFWNNF